MRKKTWIYSSKKIKSQLLEDKKMEILAGCRKFIDSDLSHYLAQKFNKNQKRSNFVIRCEWRQNFLYFIAFYKNAKINNSDCEEKFARLEYQENKKFSVAHLRHTGQWHNLNYNDGIPLKKCFEMILGLPHFQPMGF